jgi:prepilin-type N-terminal cleavage/methylation domain-containing protein/prepilin-type processing-associated H-X9-DG protein
MKQKRQTNGFTLIDLLMVMAVLSILVVVLSPSLAKNRPIATRIACTSNLKQVGLAFRIWAGDHQDTNPMQISVTNRGAMEAALSGNIVAVFQVMSNELNTPKILFCPTDKKRIQATTFDRSDPSIGKWRGNTLFGSNTNLSYFVGLDAKDTSPQMFLTGDDNLLVGGDHRGDVGGKPAPTGILSLTTNTPVAWADTRHEKQGNVGLADGSVQGFSSSALRNALANTGVETNRLAMP